MKTREQIIYCNSLLLPSGLNSYPENTIIQINKNKNNTILVNAANFIKLAKM